MIIAKLSEWVDLRATCIRRSHIPYKGDQDADAQDDARANACIYSLWTLWANGNEQKWTDAGWLNYGNSSWSSSEWMNRTARWFDCKKSSADMKNSIRLQNGRIDGLTLNCGLSDTLSKRTWEPVGRRRHTSSAYISFAPPNRCDCTQSLLLLATSGPQHARDGAMGDR